MKILFRRFQHSRLVVFISTPTHGNLGDQAIVLAQYYFFNEIGYGDDIIEITKAQYYSMRNWLSARVPSSALIVIDGGGNIGTLWAEEDAKMKDIVQLFPENPIVIFPQTIYFDGSEDGLICANKMLDIYGAHEELLIYCRDKKSFNWIKENAPQLNAYFVPDIVLSLTGIVASTSTREEILFCFREDKEKVLDEETIMTLREDVESFGLNARDTSMIAVCDKEISTKERRALLRSKWEEFSRAKLVLTDRLHAMIFCAITATPCIAFDNVSQKVSSGYYWLRNLSYIKLADECEDVHALISELLLLDECSYVDTELERRFEGMKQDLLEVLTS